MRDALKNLFSHQITLEDKSEFYYSIRPYELTNALGNVITVLQEYNITQKSDNGSGFSCSLYKTKEGNWYDMPDSNKGIEKSFLLSLKLGIDNDASKPAPVASRIQ